MEGWKQTKQLKTAEELEAMILEDLSKVDGCPKSGVTVTVYGIPWKSMLTSVLAARNMAAEGRRATALDRRHHLQLLEADWPALA